VSLRSIIDHHTTTDLSFSFLPWEIGPSHNCNAAGGSTRWPCFVFCSGPSSLDFEPGFPNSPPRSAILNHIRPCPWLQPPWRENRTSSQFLPPSSEILECKSTRSSGSLFRHRQSAIARPFRRRL
ncbi:hypothetical protein ACRALDRAFT_1051022, partial [Sodiomyces alcalophilus JCM 7366]|uniref:uncharacterized protein n=1 Tax=Sodiomyces alcalophilus JCM 7366 TaxID=591952 RepID=UPI0039B617AF